jgi:hypothetical protein
MSFDNKNEEGEERITIVGPCFKFREGKIIGFDDKEVCDKWILNSSIVTPTLGGSIFDGGWSARREATAGEQRRR